MPPLIHPIPAGFTVSQTPQGRALAVERLAFRSFLSECVHMRERYISTVMETIVPPGHGLNDAKVIELWVHRQRSP